MAFKKIETMDEQAVHERACMILYGLNPKEVKMVQNVGRLTGIKDCIIISAEAENTIVRDLLDGKVESTKEPQIKEKALIFNHIPSTQMNAAMEGLKKCRMARPLIAVVTKTSIEWSMKRLIMNLLEERRAFATGNVGEEEHQ